MSKKAMLVLTGILVLMMLGIWFWGTKVSKGGGESPARKRYRRKLQCEQVYQRCMEGRLECGPVGRTNAHGVD